MYMISLQKLNRKVFHYFYRSIMYDIDLTDIERYKVSNKQYEILALTLRYWFVLLIVYIFWQSAVKTLKNILLKNQGKRSTGNIPFVLVLFSLSAFGLLAINDPEGFNINIGLLGVLVSAILLFQFYFLYYLFIGMDEILLLVVDTLSLLGFVILQRLTPELALHQIEWFAIGNILMLIFMILIPLFKDLSRLNYPLMILGVGILFIVLFFGEESGGATSLLSIGPYSIQPSEFVKIIFIIVLAFYLKEKKSFKQNIPLFVFIACAILGVVLQKDLGSALLYFLLFIFIYYISTSDWLLTSAILAAGIFASMISYRIFSHVRVRVEAWKNPWADVGGRGYQVAQSLMAIGSGGLLGFGLGLGEPYVIPASRTDFIFAAICEEFGVLIGGMIIGFYIIFLVRGMQKALKAQNTSDMLLACGSTISLVIQAFIIIGGVIKLIPLTGITLPFISYGGSSMIVCFCILGIIQGVSIKNYRFSTDEKLEDNLEDEDDIEE